MSPLYNIVGGRIGSTPVYNLTLVSLSHHKNVPTQFYLALVLVQ